MVTRVDNYGGRRGQWLRRPYFCVVNLLGARAANPHLRQVWKNAALGQKPGDLRGTLIVSQRRHSSSWRQYWHLARASIKANPPSTRRAALVSTPRFCIIRSISLNRRRSCVCVGHSNLKFDISTPCFSASIFLDATSGAARRPCARSNSWSQNVAANAGWRGLSAGFRRQPTSGPTLTDGTQTFSSAPLGLESTKLANSNGETAGLW